MNDIKTNVVMEGQLDHIRVPHPDPLDADVTERPAGEAKSPLLVRLARKLRENEVILDFMVRAFRGLQKVGITVSPNHYYWPTPNVADLEHREWPVKSLPSGFDLHLDRQLEFLNRVAPQYSREIAFSRRCIEESGYHYNNGFFEAIDAEMAYCFVREYKPTRIVEIGGGFSTRVLACALQTNLDQDGVAGELVTIDPFPERLPRVGTWNRVRLIPKRVQEVDLDDFLSLEAGDILFVDSSHVVSIGNDVVREYLEIIPRLKRGVLVHVHDIFLPADYPRDMVLNNLAFWSEQYLLQAFLTFNQNFEVLWGSSAMQIFHPEILETIFPQWKQSYRNMSRTNRRFVPTMDGERVWPSSFWMRRV
ncbi:MAG TPA: class I SAM-dependent methyltransferase [Terriglobales bacterium]|jgi:predicted O-methyltransferase YrrM